MEHFTKMLKTVLFTTYACIFCTNCANKREIHIIGSVRNADSAPLIYYRSVDGMFNSQTFDTLNLQPDSTFALTLPGGKYERIDFSLLGKKSLGTLLTKSGTIQLQLDGRAEKPMIITSGSDEKIDHVTKILNQLSDDASAACVREGDRWGIAHDTVASSVRRKLTDYALSLDKEMKNVDKDLRTNAQQDIRMQLLHVFQNQLLTISRHASETTKQEWFAELDSMTIFCSINHPCSPFSASFYDVVNYDAAIRYNVIGEPKPEDAGEGVELAFHDYNHRLTGKAQEAALAQLFLNDENEERYDLKLVQLSDKFRKLYPKSLWLPWVNRAVDKNCSFNRTEITADFNFPDVSSAETIKDLTNLYKGKVIYMDIWATWCGPCRASFAHIGALQKYADANDIVLLYLSIDSPSDDLKWRKMVTQYNLKGEHVRLQETFHQEVYDTFGNHGTLTIPRYVIFDKQGKIRYITAASPEQMDKLQEQLLEASK